MSFLGQFFFPNFYDPGSVRTHRDMLSRTEAMAAALARDGELIGGTPAAMEDIRHRTLAALDTAEHPAGVRARTDALLARAAGAPDSALQDLLGRGGTVKLFLRLAETISRIERDPAGVWQAYRPLMEDWLTRMWYPPHAAPKPNIYIAARGVLTNPESFAATYASICGSFSHAGRVVFLEECVRHGACLPDCAGVAEQEMEHLPADGFEYWDYRNILRLSQTRARLRETPADRPAVSLSGGNSNGLAHLGALENLAGSDGTIASSVGVIAGTSMGGIMAVLAAVAPLRDIQRDIMEGFELDGRSYHLRGNTAIESDRERIMEFFIALGRRHGIDEGTRFSDLPIPVVVAASRDTLRGAQKILLGGDDAVIDALRAASNFRSPLTGRPLFGETRVDGVLLTDDAANEEGNSIDTLERLGAPYRRMVAVDVGYSSDRYDAPATRGERAGVRRMFKLATTRDTLWKATTVLAGGSVVDIDTAPSANMRGERFAPECSRRMFEIGRAAWTPARSSDKSSDIRTMPA